MMRYETELGKEAAAFLFERDSVDACEYLHTLAQRGFAEPETRLILMVFKDALNRVQTSMSWRGRQGGKRSSTKPRIGFLYR